MLAFIRNLVGVKTDQAVNGAVEAIVRWDPKSATEAELRTMEQHLDRLATLGARMNGNGHSAGDRQGARV